MAEYYNAREILPSKLISEVLNRVPTEARSGAVIYFSEDYYEKRNSEIKRCFLDYRSDPRFGSHVEIYEALSERYGLTVRQICKIVRGVRGKGRGVQKRRRRYSGVRVGRTIRRIDVRTPCR